MFLRFQIWGCLCQQSSILPDGDSFSTLTKGTSRSISIAKKGSMECKYWLNREDFGIEEAYSYGLGQNDKRAVKKIIFEYFEFIEQEWDRFMGEVRQ